MSEEKTCAYVEIMHCPAHNFWALGTTEEDEDGHGGGRRIVGGKCCGSWQTFRRWPIDKLNVVRGRT